MMTTYPPSPTTDERRNLRAGDRYREVDDERVLVCFHGSGRGKGSGLELGQLAGHAASLFQVCDGRVVRLVFYWDRDRALADLGLEG
jgi:ketosteroid isomerase-like protein